MLKIVFRYRDEYSYPNWNEQECIVSSLAECRELYGLNECEYEYISVIDLDKEDEEQKTTEKEVDENE